MEKGKSFADYTREFEKSIGVKVDDYDGCFKVSPPKTFKNCFLSTENPDPNSWIRSFLKDELMEKETEIAQRIAFNFGEFVGRTAKEEKMPVGKVLNTILECIERLTIKKK